jgi:hypothetical protein
VVNTRPAPCQEAGHAARRRGRFDELHFGVAGGQESHNRFLIGDVFDVRQLQSQAVAPEAQGGLDVVDDDRHVVNPSDMAHDFLEILLCIGDLTPAKGKLPVPGFQFPVSSCRLHTPTDHIPLATDH